MCPNTDKPKRQCDCGLTEKGRRKQNMVRKKLGITDRKFHGADTPEKIGGLLFV